jgi:hypothetical protein
MLITVLNWPGSDATILKAIGMKLRPWYSGVALYDSLRSLFQPVSQIRETRPPEYQRLLFRPACELAREVNSPLLITLDVWKARR